MINFSTVCRLASPDTGLHMCALDFPQHGAAARVTERGLYLQGWVLAQTGTQRGNLVVRVHVAGKEELRSLPFNNDRPDVIQRVLGEAPAGHAQLRCGFIAFLKDVPTQFTLGVKLADKICWLWEVELEGEYASSPKTAEMQVIRGTDNWLYLDNDTNRSVDQYTGRLTLDDDGLERWRAYFSGCAAIAKDAEARHGILIAASKEQVLPEHYPHKKAELTVHEQVLALCHCSDSVLDTAQLFLLRTDKASCFIKTDTHWTDRGAMQATLALLERLALDVEAAGQHIAKDVYYTMPFVGDLGIKLLPVQSAPTEFLQAPPAVNGAVFDNQLPNIGRVIIFEYADALWPHSLLMFGASSSYPMMKYLKRLFGRIVFVHSAGNVDQDIVRHERPDFLVMQTTGRFMIEPPDTAFRLREAVLSKLSDVTDDVKASAISLSAKEPINAKNAPYHAMLRPDQ
jgi:alginate O-acetyltransferase complex protein AlgJ